MFLFYLFINKDWVLLWWLWASYWEHWTSCWVCCWGVVSLTFAPPSPSLCCWCRNVSYVLWISWKLKSAPRAPHRWDAPFTGDSLFSHVWPLCSFFLLQTKTLRTMTRGTAAALRPRPKEPRCPWRRRWAWVPSDAPPPPPAPSQQVRVHAVRLTCHIKKKHITVSLLPQYAFI